jgi:putative Mg2+ transporter-C (MgtC) family protein
MADLSTFEMIGRLVLAAALGAAVGAERELKGQDAGLRTHLMLALGAALFGLISVGAWDDFFGRTNETNYRVDVTRVASYVAAGIGFIGGGAILKQAGGVRGLTTASSLWVVAAIGLSCGVGFWIPAVAAALLSVVSLVALVPVRSIMRRAAARRGGNIVVSLHDERGFTALVETLQNQLPMTPAHIRAGPATAGQGYEVVISYPEEDPLVLAECASTIAGLDVVSGVHIDTT